MVAIQELGLCRGVSNTCSKVALNILEGEKVSNFYNFSSKEYFSVMDIYNELCLIHGEIVEPIYDINSEFEIKDQQQLQQNFK